MFWCKPKSQSTSSSSCCSNSESSLQPGGYLDLGRTTECQVDSYNKNRQLRKQSDHLRPECTTDSRPKCSTTSRAESPARTRSESLEKSRPECSSQPRDTRDLKPAQDESKHHVQIKIMEKKKARDSPDQEVLNINLPRGSYTGLGDIAGKAVSAISNRLSHIFKPIEKISDKNDEKFEIVETKYLKEADKGDDRTKKIQSSYPSQAKHYDNSEKQEKMNELIEKFKADAFNADDQIFDDLFNKLKKELDRLACVCPGVNEVANTTSETEKKRKVNEEATQPQKNISNVRENDKGFTSDETKKEYCLNKNELQDMFADLKSVLQENVCACNKTSNEEKPNTDKKDSGNTEVANPCDNKSGCKCTQVQSKQENSQPESEKDVKEIKENISISNDLAEFYNKIASKLDEISQQYLDNKHLNDATQDNAVVVDSSLPSEQGKNLNTSPADPLNTSGEGEKNEKNDETEKIKSENKPSGEDEESATTYYSFTKTEDTLAQNQGDKKTIALDEFVNLVNELKEVIQTSSCKCTNRTGSDGQVLTNLEGDSAAYDQNSELTLLRRAALDPLSLSDLFPKQPGRFDVIESPAASFYSAECANGPNTKQVENIAVNTQCKCFSDQVVQTFEDMRVSYGVICQKQLPPGEQDISEVSDIQIRQKMSPDGDIERIKVRIRLNDGGNKTEIENVIASNGEKELGKSSKFVKSFADYEVACETNELEIEEPKVVRNGSIIKIFIPLESLKAN